MGEQTPVTSLTRAQPCNTQYRPLTVRHKDGTQRLIRACNTYHTPSVARRCTPDTPFSGGDLAVAIRRHLNSTRTPLARNVGDISFLLRSIGNKSTKRPQTYMAHSN